MKTDIINKYNVTKGGFDVVDEMECSYSVARNSNRWPLTLFVFTNEYCWNKFSNCFSKECGKKVVRHYSLKKLALDLIKEYINERKHTITLPKPFKRKIRKFCGESTKKKLLDVKKLNGVIFCTTK